MDITPQSVQSHPMNKQARLSIEDLPNECLFEILRRLPGCRARSVSACVSKRWLMLISNIHNSDMSVPNTYVCDPHMTRHLENPPATDISLSALSVGASSHGGLRELKINFTDRVTDAGLKAIAYGSPSLRVLSLQHVPFVGDKGLLEIAKECHKLEKLDLCLCHLVTNRGLVTMAKSMLCLTSLVIEYCNNIGNESLVEFGLCCRKLKSVYIRGCPLVGDEGVGKLVLLCTVMSELKLQDLHIGDKALAEIGLHGRALTNLALLGLQETTANGFSLMGKLGGLEKLASLTITSCPGINDEVLHAIGDGCRSLNRIRLCECSYISDNGIRVFVQVSDSLVSLCLEKCHGVTLSGVLGALSSCGSKLQTLALVKCIGLDPYLGAKTPISFPCDSLYSLRIESYSVFGNRSLAMVGMLCPHLEMIDLSGCISLTDSGLLPLVESCCLAGLVEVILDGCANLTDEVVSGIAKRHGRTLEMLSLGGCIKVTDASLVAIADNCFVLKHLDVARCSITDFGVATLTLEGLRKLRNLSICGCSMVTDMSLAFLLKLKKNLRSFSYSECKSISDRTVKALDRMDAQLNRTAFSGVEVATVGWTQMVRMPSKSQQIEIEMRKWRRWPIARVLVHGW